MFVALQLPVALATNFGMMLAFRFITGFVGSPVLATGGASLTDIYEPRKQAYAICLWGISAGKFGVSDGLSLRIDLDPGTLRSSLQ